jgi:hypothetical protein
VNVERCRHFLDFARPRCAVEIKIDDVRDGLRVPCIADTHFLHGGKPCVEASFPTEDEVDAHLDEILLKARRARRK